MKKTQVKDLMVPLSDYATVSEESTLYDAVLALERAHKRKAGDSDRLRTVLVLDRNGSTVGKVSIWDVLRSIEPRYRDLAFPREPAPDTYRLGYVKTMLETYGLWRESLNEICRKAAELHVKEIMHAPAREEFIEEDASLSEATNQFVVGNHQILVVTRQGKTIGLLRAIDLFREVCHKIRICSMQ